MDREMRDTERWMEVEGEMDGEMDEGWMRDG